MISQWYRDLISRNVISCWHLHDILVWDLHDIISVVMQVISFVHIVDPKMHPLYWSHESFSPSMLVIFSSILYRLMLHWYCKDNIVCLSQWYHKIISLHDTFLISVQHQSVSTQRHRCDLIERYRMACQKWYRCDKHKMISLQDTFLISVKRQSVSTQRHHCDLIERYHMACP